MKRINYLKWKYLCLVIIFIASCNFSNNDRNIKKNSINNSSVLISNNEYHFDYIDGSNFFNLNISSNRSMDFNINYDDLSLTTNSKQIKINVSSLYNLEFNLTAIFNWNIIKNNFPTNMNYNNNHLNFLYNTTYKISSNTTISDLNLKFLKLPIYGLDPNMDYSIAYYTNQNNLNLIETNEEISSEYNYLEASVKNLQNNTDYYITIFKITKLSSVDLVFIITLSILIPISIISIISIISVISKKDYVRTLKKRTQKFSTGIHRLTLDEVLENENRNKIIDIILEKPGIHFNKLLRHTNLTPGSLVWHLEILNVYRIIKRKTIDNYVIYVPYIEKNPISNIDLTLQKSEMSLKILKIIEDEPGIWNSKIAKILNISRKTTEYHVRKLEDLKLIYGIRKGNINALFPNIQVDNERNNENS
ncbi:MAG: winged helix-turn-helix transcriptional regulator [Candidatus Lokiarchaeota archaeon]|nr:winged helix-turn-helix transcriptional regulator [Candidatus Lokiarchaeota archaeon]